MSELRTMHRHPDHETSVDAAVSVLPSADNLRQQVLQIIVARGPITALEIEELPQFRHLAPTTVRKRASELLASNQVEEFDRRAVTLSNGRQARAMSYVVRR